MVLSFAMDLGQYDFLPLGLEDLKDAVLMNRQEYKFLLAADQLPTMLDLLQGAYGVLVIGEAQVQQYYSRYYDTESFDCYFAYQNGRPERHKVRWRQYVNTGVGFLELKKAKHSRTVKMRVSAPQPDQLTEGGLLRDQAIDAGELRPVLDVTYDRITLVRTQPTPERLTLDFNLRLTSTASGLTQAFPDVVIAELKCQEGLPSTYFSGVARQLGLHPTRLSKYGVGCALHHPHLRRNRLLPQLRQLKRLQAGGG